MPITEEPNFGDWKINVVETPRKEPAATASFKVKKYVLPKFEVKLTHPPHVLINAKTLDVTACAQYVKFTKFLIDFEVTVNLFLFSDIHMVKVLKAG